ncbi:MULTISPECIES: hypothetical protein [unclassified Mesotoga]|uniref:hypothetical protein n=1 Tax=unclassified Mesotoga TaxID=1184398 RepID=UPI0013FD2674|nr:MULTISPECIES: hypothetical protein [unclassified Mesotoga]
MWISGQANQGRLCRMTVFLTSGHPGTLLARISIFGAFSRPDPVQIHHGKTEYVD